MIIKTDDQSKLEKPKKIKDETYNVNNVSVLQMVWNTYLFYRKY